MTAATNSPAPGVERDLDKAVTGLSLMAATANVIMQLARPGVGYGVVESRVDSGNVFKHPVKRGRTTLTYVVLAMTGTDEEKRRFVRGVNKAHAQVRSTESSPVEYNAFSHDLQLWVAACLYKGVEDINLLVGPERSDGEWQRIYREAAAFGTTLQVPHEKWPADREEFERYWKESLDKVEVDDTVREYLHDLIWFRFTRPWVGFLFGRLNLFLTTGFLPQEFRDQLRLQWTDAQQCRFDRLMSALGVVNRAMPKPLREFPFNLLMRDLRWRIRTGRPLT